MIFDFKVRARKRHYYSVEVTYYKREGERSNRKKDQRLNTDKVPLGSTTTIFPNYHPKCLFRLTFIFSLDEGSRYLLLSKSGRRYILAANGLHSAMNKLPKEKELLCNGVIDYNISYLGYFRDPAGDRTFFEYIFGASMNDTMILYLGTRHLTKQINRELKWFKKNMDLKKK